MPEIFFPTLLILANLKKFNKTKEDEKKYCLKGPHSFMRGAVQELQKKIYRSMYKIVLYVGCIVIYLCV